MKTYTPIIALLFLTIGVSTSCKKKNEDPRDPYLGNYSVTDSSFGTGNTFLGSSAHIIMVSTENTVSDTIYLKNLFNDGNNYRALISGANFSIPSGQGFVGPNMSGSGSFGENSITYSTTSPGSSYSRRGKGTK